MLMELSPREILIAQGQNPDAPEVEDTTPDAVADGADGKQVEQVEEKAVASEAAADTNKEVGKDASKEASVDGAQPEQDAKAGSGGQPAGSVSSGGGKEAASPSVAESKPDSKPSKADDSWIDDDVRALAESYQIPEAELKSFGSAAEFQRAARFLDQQLVKPVKPVQPAQPKAEEKPQTPVAAQPTEGTAKKPVELDPRKWREAGYDEDTIALVEHAKGLEEKYKTLEPQVAMMAKAFQETESRRQINAFHDAVDALGDKRFGKSLSEAGEPKQLSQAEHDSRRKLFEAAETLAAGMIARAKAAGQQPVMPPVAVMLKRARNYAFAEEIQAEQQRAQAEKIAEQSRKRRPVGASRTVVAAAKPASGSGPNDVAKNIADNPEVKALWDKLQQANGSE